MSEPSKITLFNFRTSRIPELLSPTVRKTYYVDFPEPMEATSPFFIAVANKGAMESTRDAMDNAASSFTPMPLDVIKDLNENLYNLGLYLATNKNNVDKEEVNNIIIDGENPVTLLETPDKELLWNNLFFYSISLENAYAREAILYLLLADHFKDKFDHPEITEEETLKLANSKVVVPTELFKVEDDYQSASTETSIGPNAELLEKYMLALENNLLANWAFNAVKEVTEEELNYWSTEKTAETTAVATYVAEQKSNSNVPTNSATDQFSGYTVDQASEPIAEANFTYSPAPQINVPNLQSSLSQEAFYILNENDLLTKDTFSGITEDVELYINEKTDEVFHNTEFGLESIDVNGTAIPTCNIENRYNQKYSYMFKALKKADDKYALLLAVDIGSACTRLRSMSIEIGNPVSQTFTKFKANNQNGIITIHVTQGNVANISDALGEIESSGQLKFDSGLILSFSDDLEMDDYGTTGYMIPSDSTGATGDLFIPSGYGLTQLGIDEYKRVEQTLCCYVPGEVSHIENVMAREYKERSTKRTRLKEETSTQSFENESENLTDTSSTTRFDMQKEVGEVLSKSNEYGSNKEIHAGASVSAKYSVAQIDANAGFSNGSNHASNSSKEQSNQFSTNFAEDITRKTVERVNAKVSEQRTSKIIEEFEESNKHGFDNRTGAVHISGVYRWVDKIYKNEVRNYGKRLQYEFMIPEPAVFHLLAKKRGASNSTKSTLVKPIDPRSGQFGSLKALKSANAITKNNYQQWAAMYGAEVSPPPEDTLVVGRSFRKPEVKDNYVVSHSVIEDIPIPEGYGLNKAYVSARGKRYDKGGTWARYNFSIGDNTRSYWTNRLFKSRFLQDNETLELDKFIDKVPIGIEFFGIVGGLANVTLELKRKPQKLIQWQLETFQSIITAYKERLQEYEDRVAEMEAIRGNQLADNPKYYREIEETVLKKNCISYLIGHTNMGKSYVKGSRMGNSRVDISKSMDEYSALVKFTEQAFEWGVMSYKFYPFYWAGKNKWTELYDIDNDDATFKSFLQAGMARVVVTVRPGFENAVLNFMASGQIWDGGEAPIIGDDLYLSIVEEMKETEYTIENSWETRVPSTLTLIQSDTVALNASGLPCYCESGEPPVENIDNDGTTLSNLNVFVEGYSAPEV